jgi:hypothetical protein
VHPAPGRRSDQFNQALAVDDATGVIGLVYEETGGDPARLAADLWYQSSADHGVTWSCPEKVTGAPTNESDANADSGQFGDYNGLSAVAGVFLPSWTDRRGSGFEEVWTAPLAPQQGPAPQCPPDACLGRPCLPVGPTQGASLL